MQKTFLDINIDILDERIQTFVDNKGIEIIATQTDWKLIAETPENVMQWHKATIFWKKLRPISEVAKQPRFFKEQTAPSTGTQGVEAGAAWINKRSPARIDIKFDNDTRANIAIADVIDNKWTDPKTGINYIVKENPSKNGNPRAPVYRLYFN